MNQRRTNIRWGALLLTVAMLLQCALPALAIEMPTGGDDRPAVTETAAPATGSPAATTPTTDSPEPATPVTETPAGTTPVTGSPETAPPAADTEAPSTGAPVPPPISNGVPDSSAPLVALAATAPAATSGYAQVKLTWGAVEGATGYVIYRAESVEALSEAAALTTVAATEYLDKAVATGVSYWYRVDATAGAATTDGTPVQAAETGLAALQAAAPIHYDLLDTRFDGSVALDKSEDLSKIIGLTQGSVIAKVRFTGGNVDQVFPILGIGNSTLNAAKVAMFGVQQFKNVSPATMTARYELCDGLYSSAATFAPFSDGQWHTIVYTAGKGYVNVTIDGKSGATGADGYYANSKWDNFLTRTQDANSLTIGGIQGVTANASKSPYANWVGDIAYVTVTDEVLMQDAANQLTADEQANTPELPPDPDAPVVEITTPVTVTGGNGPTFHAALDSLKATADLTVFVDFQQLDSGLGSLFSVSNSKAEKEHFHLYAWGGKIGYEMRSVIGGTEENLSTSYAVSANAPHKLAFVASSTDHTFKLFVDGVLVNTKPLTAETYHMLSTIHNLDSVSVGKTPRDNGKMPNDANQYPLSGTINGLAVYTKAVTDAEALDYTAPTQPDGPVIEITTPTAITSGNGASYPDTLATLKGATDLTVTAQFVQGTTDIGSLFSVSNSAQGAVHFHVYANGPTLGFELRGVPGGDIKASASKLRSAGVNTVAFSADSTAKTLKLFANGELVSTTALSDATYRMFKDMAGVNSVKVGSTPRSGNTYPFTGTIAELAVYDRALTDADLIAYTGKTPTKPEKPLPERTTQPFLSGISAGSNYFRIPALLTLNNGDIMAAIDARFGGTADSPNNLDTTVNFLRVDEEMWEGATLPNQFLDYSDGGGYKGDSASFIDPQIIQLPSDDAQYPDRLYLMVDAYPYGAGINTLPGNSHNGVMVVGGQSYLALTNGDRTNFSGFAHYLAPNDAPAEDGHDAYLVMEQSGTATGYTTDGFFNLYQNGIALTMAQLNNPSEQVPMNIFYKGAPFQLYPTSYLYLTHSDDGGLTWSAPRIIGNDQRTAANGNFLGVGPGRGHVVQNGDYKGRVMFTVYDEGVNDSGTDNRKERASVLYSDDGGDSWTLSQRTTMAATNSPGKSSEAQIVELPDGTLRMFARGNTGKIGYCDSIDGGESWSPMVQDPGLSYVGNCMISVINYSQEIDGKPALILASPEGPSRMNGIIRIGLIHEDNTIDWKYRFEVNSGAYGYSCLTELPNGDVALLYEYEVGSTDPGKSIVYATYTVDELMSADRPLDLTLSSEPAFGQPYTVTLPLGGTVVDFLSNLKGSTLTVTYPGSGIPAGTLTFKEKTADGKGLVYQGTWPAALEDGSGYDFSITLPANFPVYTLDGQITAAKYAPLTGLVGSYQKYSVTVADTKYGVITADPKTAEAGSTVTLTVTPDSGYSLKTDSLSVSGVTEITAVNATTFTFQMPAESVTVTAVFEAVTIPPTVYTVTVGVLIGGAVNATPAKAEAGGTVTLTVTPNSGYYYVPGTLTVSGPAGPIAVTAVSGSVFSFQMPDGDVSVSARFQIQYVDSGDDYDEPDPSPKPDVDITDPDVPLGDLPYPDVPDDHWAKDAILFVHGAGLMTGTSSGFAPEGTASRAMVATILHRLAGEPAAAGTTTFGDVPSGAWYADAATWAAGQGIVSGVGDKTFAPDRDVTRQELAVLFYRYAKFAGMDTTPGGMALSEFSDKGDVAPWATDAMLWAVQNGIITGKADQKLDPNATASRAELAVMLQRLEKLLSAKEQ